MRFVVEWFPSGDTPCRPRMNDAEDCGNSSKLLSLKNVLKVHLCFTGVTTKIDGHKRNRKTPI